MSASLTDMKEALSSTRKPDITHVRTPLMVYCARNCEYGNAKYQRANYLRKTPSLADDFRRARSYARAAVSHLVLMLDAMEAHEAQDPELKDEVGMRIATYAADTDETPGAKVRASRLPHIGGAVASINMLLAQAVQAGLLPADPGTPWVPFTTLQASRVTVPGKRIVRRGDMSKNQRGWYCDANGERLDTEPHPGANGSLKCEEQGGVPGIHCHDWVLLTEESE